MNRTPLVVNREAWEQAGERLRTGDLSLVSLWGEPGWAHMALMPDLQLLSFKCEAAR